MLRIGLTGGIASGKSTVAQFFADLGADIIDTDRIAREIVASGTPGLAAVIEAFGQDVVDRKGELDRRKMRRLVFDDAGKRRRLEAILHPRIRHEALARATASDGPYVIFVVPLLFETGFDQLVERTVVTDCPGSLQIERLIARDGIDADAAARMIAAQMDRDERLARADDVIDTSAELETTRARVGNLHDLYLKLAENCPEVEGRAE